MIITTCLIVLLAAPVAVYCWLQNPQAEDGKIHLRYMAWGTPEQQVTERKILDGFEQLHPDIKVDDLIIPATEYFQKEQIMLASRTEPDVFRVDLYYYPGYAKHGYFLPLDHFIAADRSFSLKDFLPQPIEEMTVDGQLMGMNVIFGGQVLYYNKDLFKAAGLPDPYDEFKKGHWTLDAFLHDARKLTIVDPATHQVRQIGCVLEGDDPWIFTWDFGGNIVSLDGKVEADQPASIAGLTFFSDLIHKYHVMPPPVATAISIFNFEAGNVGMINGWAGESPRYRQNAHFKWDICPMPRGPAGQFTMCKGNALVISARTSHPRKCWELLKYMTSPAVEREYCGDTLRRAIPTRRSVAESPDFLHASQPPFNTGTFVNIYQAGRRLPITDRWNEWQPAYMNWIERLDSDDPRIHTTPAQTGAGMKRDIQPILDRPDF